jgi:16S rRNA (cytosine967-C5)-methyltransferase
VPRSLRAKQALSRRGSQSNARQVALAALRTWRTRRLLADAVASNLLAKVELTPADRAFGLELFYGVLRNATLLDFWIGCLRRAHVRADLRDVLRIGLYQLFLLKTPEHAAVNETVALTGKSGRALVNAVLRAAVREKDQLQAKASTQPLAVRSSHPEFLIDRWQRQFGTDATEQLCRWNNQPPLLYARINGLRIGRSDFLALYRDARPLPSHSQFLEFQSLPASALEAGHCYVQDPSTSLACRLLDPQPHERVLDACAAPGGKTGQIAELMQNRGVLVASDRTVARLELLQQNITRLGAAIAKVVRADWTHEPVPREVIAQAPYDRVLLDTPCTNTGVMRRRVDVRWRLRSDDFARMQDRQLQIVRALHPLLRPGGVLVYSTCSLECEENEELTAKVLRAFPDLRLVEQACLLPFRDHLDGVFAAKLRRGADAWTLRAARLHAARAMES